MHRFFEGTTMKKLFAPLLLSYLVACNAAQTSTVRAVESSDLLPETVMSTDNEVGECAIDWTAEKIAKISKDDDRDLPLKVDLKKFRTLAKSKVKQYFGETAEGKIYFQDTISKNSEVTFDKTALYYLVPISLIQPDESSLSTYYYSYSISTSGEINVGFASTNGKTDKIYVDLEYPDLLISFKGERGDDETSAQWNARKEEAGKILKNFQSLAPSLAWDISTALIVWAQASVNLTPAEGDVSFQDQMKEVGELFKAIPNSKQPFGIEMNKRTHEGGATNAHMLEIKDSESSIDLNALRTVSKSAFAKEVPLNTLPSLPAPFGIGCRIYNPKIGMSPESAK